MATSITYISGSTANTVEMAAILNNSHFARSFDMGSNWTNLRIGIRWIFVNPPLLGGAPINPITGVPFFFMGLSHGTSSVMGDSYVSHSVGLAVSGSSWNYGASGAPVYSIPAYIGCVKTGSVLTYFGPGYDGNTPTVYISGSGITQGTSCRVSMLFADFQRNTPNTFFTMSVFFRRNASADNNTTSDLLYYGQQTTPVLTNYEYTSSVSFLPIDETGNGTLDSVCIMWDKSAPNPCIADIAIFKLA